MDPRNSTIFPLNSHEEQKRMLIIGTGPSSWAQCKFSNQIHGLVQVLTLWLLFYYDGSMKLLRFLVSGSVQYLLVSFKNMLNTEYYEIFNDK